MENAQFSVAFPKSWNENTITFRAFFTVTGTNTGTVKWELSGVSMGDNDAIGAGFGTAIGPQQQRLIVVHQMISI